MLDSIGGVWYLFVDVNGEGNTSRTVPEGRAINPTAWSWIQLRSPNTTIYYIGLTPAGEITSPSISPPPGVGTTAIVQFINRDSRTYQFRLTDAPGPELSLIQVA